MRRLPPLNAIRAFEAAARHGSFTRAAAELNVTHGAVSRQVAQLEAWVGAALFRRLTRRVILTEEGQALLEEVGPALDRISMAAVGLSNRKALPLSVSAPPTFTMRWLIPRLSTFQKRHPEIDVRLTSSIDPVDFSRRSYDLAIRRAKEPWLNVESRPFLPEDGMPVCSPDLIEELPLGSPEDLSRHTLIHSSTEPEAWPDWLEAAGCKGLRPAGTLNFEHLYYALQAAVDGLGIAIAPFPLVADDVASGRLHIPFHMSSKVRRYYAVHPRIPHKQEALDAFCNWLVEEGAAAAQFYDDSRRAVEAPTLPRV